MKRNTTKTAHIAVQDMGVCHFCGEIIAKGRRVMPAYNGTDDFVHVTCWDRDWAVTMEKHRQQFEKGLLL